MRDFIDLNQFSIEINIIIGGTGFHNNAVIVNPQDIAPAHSGSVFGLMNTFGAIPGKILLISNFNCGFVAHFSLFLCTTCFIWACYFFYLFFLSSKIQFRRMATVLE